MKKRVVMKALNRDMVIIKVVKKKVLDGRSCRYLVCCMFIN